MMIFNMQARPEPTPWSGGYATPPAPTGQIEGSDAAGIFEGSDVAGEIEGSD